jgi:hypothetical protein
MRRVKKTLSLGSVFLGLEFLALAVFGSPSFAWTNQHFSALLSAIRSLHVPTVRLDSPVKNDGSNLFEKDVKTTPDSGLFLAATERAQAFLRIAIVAPACFKVILTPKVSRCISKSVLNL